MNNIYFYTIAILILSLAACQEDETTPGGSGNGANGNGNANMGWLIPENRVLDGGPGKDGIPALENPEMISPAQATYLGPDDLVIGYKVGDDTRAYSHKVLDWHEIINDEVGDQPIAITYCPLTGTGIAWGRELQGTVTTFGVSGLLYNSNLIPYDRATDSNWSQMRLDCVEGTLQGTKIETFPLVETSWKTWLAMYPETKVVSTNTGFSRNYQQYPYGDYRTNHNNIIFPVSHTDNRLSSKDRVLGVIIDGQAKAYFMENFGSETRLFAESFMKKDIIVAGNNDQNWAVAYEATLTDGTELSFTPVQDALPIILEDQLGNHWDMFGQAVSGPNQGERMPKLDAYIGYWFAWAAFYEDINLSGFEGLN